ncbi:MAG TPA: hypothetical protein VNT75_14490, partial [Symbiobacteriaceae bacterium]|nr:hypothetical protein [Symbiobacteriaceae bacterium]
MDRRVWSILGLLLLAGCSAPAPAPEPPAQVAPAPAIQAAPEPPAQGAPAPVVQEIPPLYEPPAPKDARLLTPDPTGRYIADVDKQLRVDDYTGNAVAAPEIPGDAVQYLVWAPRGDRLVVATGKPTLEPGVVKEARYWVVTLESGSAVELTGLPQDVVFSWALDQQSLYVLDNWRRTPPKGEYGERIQRYDLATG